MVLPTLKMACLVILNAYGVSGIIDVPRNVSVVPSINLLARKYSEIP
jgi:hypothetical protein